MAPNTIAVSGDSFAWRQRTTTRPVYTDTWEQTSLSASAMVSAQVLPNLHIDVAGRQSYLDKLLPLVTKADVGEFVPIPRYDDYQARISLNLRKDERLEAVFLASDDHLTRTIASDDPAQTRSQSQDTSFKRLLLRYTRVLPDGASIAITPSFGYDTDKEVSKFGPVPAVLSTTSWDYALRASYRRRLASMLVLSMGSDLQGSLYSTSRAGSIDIPPREGDIKLSSGNRPEAMHERRQLDQPHRERGPDTPCWRSPSTS